MPELVHTKEKTTSAFLAAALGDAMGWPNEAPRKGDKQKPGTWGRMLGSRFAPILEVVRNGEYSDDTQLILAVARSILAHGADWPNHFCQVELPAWRLYERGGGRATKTAAEILSEGRIPWDPNNSPEVLKAYYEAGGNGAAMRILPHVVFRLTADHPEMELRRDVLSNSITTHGHPRAIIGALTHAFSIAYAIKKTSTLEYGELVQDVIDTLEKFTFEECAPVFDGKWLTCSEQYYGGRQRFSKIWNNTVREVAEMLEATEAEMGRGPLASEVEFLKRIGALSRETNGAGTVSAVAALFLASRYATDPMAGLQTTSRIRGLDSDTVASMCGSILAGINGSSWMGTELIGLQDSDYIRRIASKLSTAAESTNVWATKEIVGPPKAPSFSKRDLGELNPKSSADIPLLGTIHIEETKVLYDRKRSVAVTVAVAKAFDGQTIFLYSSQKKLAPEQQEQRLESPQEFSGPKTGVRFYTRDLSSIRAFYEGVLDWKPENVTLASVVYPSNIVFADPKDSGADLFISHSSGGQALIMEVKDFETFKTRIASKDVGSRNDWFVRKSSRPMLVLHDPDGRRIEVFAAKDSVSR